MHFRVFSKGGVGSEGYFGLSGSEGGGGKEYLNFTTHVHVIYEFIIIRIFQVS